MNKLLYLPCLLVLMACGGEQTPADEQPATAITLQGEAQGTTYSITFLTAEGKEKAVTKTDIDSILTVFDQSLSTYQLESHISMFNTLNQPILYAGVPFFEAVYNLSLEVAAQTEGAFDVRIKPLVNYWGFGEEKWTNDVVDSAAVDSILQLVTQGEITFVYYYDTLVTNTAPTTPTGVVKDDARVKLDFNAVAQGYSVDVLANYLESNGCSNYMVELGGEVRAKGVNAEGLAWRIGVDKPVEDAVERELQAIVSLQDKALATSGSYRKFYEKNGIKYSHTINPKTGYPVNHSLLSATVMANDCGTADAYATAFMVMGVEATQAFLTTHPELEVYLIYANAAGEWETFASPGMVEVLEELE